MVFYDAVGSEGAVRGAERARVYKHPEADVSDRAVARWGGQAALQGGG